MEGFQKESLRDLDIGKQRNIKNLHFLLQNISWMIVLPDEHFNVWQLIVHITELVFGYGRNGLAAGMKLTMLHVVASYEPFALQLQII